MTTRSLCFALTAAVALLTAAAPSRANDKLRVGKAINVIWAMVPVDIGVQKGIFDKYGLDVEITTMSGDAKLQQGLVANSLDIGLAGGTSLVVAVKGSPVLGIAAIAGAPRNFAA